MDDLPGKWTVKGYAQARAITESQARRRLTYLERTGRARSVLCTGRGARASSLADRCFDPAPYRYRLWTVYDIREGVPSVP